MLSKTFILIVLVLLLASLFALAENPAQEHKIFLHDLKKIGASKSELDTLGILLNTNASQGEIEKRSSSIIQRRLSKFSPSQQKVYYDLGDEERLDYLASSDPDRWVKSRDRKLAQKLCTTREGKVQYYSLRDLLDPKELQDFIRQDSSGRMEWLKRYWSFKDPTPTTARNEWKEEFDSRVDFALANFHSVFGEKPWDDRGDIYIKLGAPPERELSVDNSWKGTTERWKGPLTTGEEEFYRTAGEIWTYFIRGKEVHFQFEDMKFTGNFTLVPYQSSNRTENLDYLSNYQVEKTNVETSKAIYRHDYGGKSMDFAWEVIKFRTLKNVYEILVNVGIPTDKIGRDSLGTIRYDQQIAIKNANGEIIRSDSNRVVQKIPNVLDDLMLVDQKQFFLTPGAYTVALQIRDHINGKIGLYQDNLFLPAYTDSGSGLSLSRAILSSKVIDGLPGKEDDKFYLNGHWVYPNPGHVFFKDQVPDIKAYFEIYNLQPKNDSLKFLTISYLIKYSEHDSAMVTSDTMQIVHPGFQPGTVAYQILPLNSNPHLEPGDYIWRIDVVDLNAPYKVESILDKLRII